MKTRCVLVIVLLSLVQSIPVGSAIDIPHYNTNVEGTSLKFEQLIPDPDFSGIPITQCDFKI